MNGAQGQIMVERMHTFVIVRRLMGTIKEPRNLFIDSPKMFHTMRSYFIKRRN